MTMAQLAKINTIPTYNYYMTEQTAAFVEQGTGESREKRDMNVVITSAGDAVGEDIFATIFVVKKDGSQVFGPFTVYNNEPFSYSLPKGKWGVTVNSNWDVTLSVWIGKGGRSLE
jgi:multimeric flavodoxin WrbA